MHEAVREPDRARRDDAVRRAPRLARGAAGRPARAAAHRAQHGRPGSRRARPGRRARATRRAPVRRGGRGAAAAAPLAPGGGAPRRAAGGDAERDMGARPARPRDRGRRGARGRPGRRGGRRSDIRGAGRDRLPDRDLLLHALPDFSRPARVRPGAAAPRRDRRAEQPAAARHPSVALPVLPETARLGGGAGGHRPRAGALRGDRRHPSQRRGQPAGLARRGAAGALGRWPAGMRRPRATSSAPSATRSRRGVSSTTSPA